MGLAIFLGIHLYTQRTCSIHENDHIALVIIPLIEGHSHDDFVPG